MLEFVTPTVEISGSNGESKSFTLTRSDFNESDKGGAITINVTVNGETTTLSSTAVNNIAECMKRFETESIEGHISVKYTLNANAQPTKDKYVFFHNVGYDCKAKNENNLLVTTNGSYTIPTAYEISKEDVKKYLDELVASGDETPFKVSVAKPK